jgi:hypothetical protein
MNNLFIKFFGTFCMLSFFFSACTGIKGNNNQLTDAEKKEGWVLLFDGKSMDGWHLYNKGKVRSAWMVKDDELYCSPDSGITHGDLVSDQEFENFDLSFDWKIAKAGNSGVFINVIERPDIPAAWASGPEYQLLENSNPDYPNPVERSGCLFGFTAQKNPVEPKASGEWNQSRIKQVNGKTEFYLNGVLTTEEDFSSHAWLDKIAQTNFFKQLPEFGKHTKGHIGLQDWAKSVSFRNIKIRHL